mgnify:CR=1 FL=1
MAAVFILLVMALSYQPKAVFAQASASGSLGGNGGLGADLGGILGIGANCALSAIGGLGGDGGGDNPLGGTITSLFGGDDGENDLAGGVTEGGLEDVVSQASSSMSTVPVNDQGAISSINDFDSSASAKLKVIKKEELKDTKKEGCLDKIVKYAATKALDKITLATVDWINNGFEGQPHYLEDTAGFFSVIATEEINMVTGGLTGCFQAGNCPFGQDVMEAILTNLQRDFYQEAQFSLNEVLAHGTAEEFSVDFSVGGWAGYVGMLRPANNPISQYFETNNYIARQIQGTSINASLDFRSQLTQSGGFLDQRECVLTATGDPEDDYIPEDDPYHTPTGGPVPDVVYTEIQYNPNLQTPMTEEQAYDLQVFTMRSVCRQWRNLTPGGIISDQIKDAIKIPQEELLMADELNEDIGLIIDALLTQLVEQGLNSLSSADTGGTAADNVLLAQVQGLQPGQVANGNVPPSGVDVIVGTNTLNSAMDIQNEYITLAEAPGTGALALLNELIAKTRALDYCVPGPNPYWAARGEAKLVEILTAIIPFVSSNPDQALAAQENQDYYSTQIFNLTGVDIDESTDMDSYAEFVAFMENVFNLYSERMQDTTDGGYNLINPPPSVRPLLPSLFYNMGTYQAELDFLNNYLANITNYLILLGNIQTALAQIAANNGGVLDPNDPNVQAQISVYNSISANFVTQDQLDSLINRITYYEAQIGVTEGHLNACIQETVNANYPYPDQRVAYPPPVFPFTQTIAPFTSLPAPDADFLPGIDFGTGANDINVEFNGVTIDNPSNGLDVFEDALESVY